MEIKRDINAVTERVMARYMFMKERQKQRVDPLKVTSKQHTAWQSIRWRSRHKNYESDGGPLRMECKSHTLWVRKRRERTRERERGENTRWSYENNIHLMLRLPSLNPNLKSTFYTIFDTSGNSNTELTYYYQFFFLFFSNINYTFINTDMS